MDPGSPQLVRCYVLTQNRLHHAGAGQAKKSIPGLDKETALAGQITAAAGIKPEHAHNAGNDTADLAQSGKGIGIAIQPPNTSGNVGAGRIIQTDQGYASGCRQFKQPRQLLAVGRVHGAGTNREVVPVNRHIPTVDLNDGRDQ